MTMEAAVHGRLGRDPEQRTTRTGNPMCVASLAVDVTAYNADAPMTLWVSVTAFGDAAELLSKHGKGDMLSVHGRMTLSRWEDAAGNDRETWQMVVESIVSARTARPGNRRKRTKKSGNAHQDHAPSSVAPFDDPIPDMGG